MDAGITETARDKEMLAEGRMPASLMVSDEVHFNPYGYELTGRLIYNRMEQLGYFDKVREAMAEFID